MNDLLDPEDPASLEFVRAGAEQVVSTMTDDHRARSAMIYAHITALIGLVQATGDDNDLSQETIEAFMGDLPPDYRAAFMLDTVRKVTVDGFDDEATRQRALAGTERGQMPKQRERYEYKVMTVALTNAQETACALGKAGWRQSGQSTPNFPPRDSPIPGPPHPPAVTLSFWRTLEEKKSEIQTTPATGVPDSEPLVQLGLGAGGTQND